MMIYRVFIKYRVLFPRILESLPPLPRQHSAAIGCSKNYQPIGVTVRALKVTYSDVSEGGAAVNCEKIIIFPEHPISPKSHGC